MAYLPGMLLNIMVLVVNLAIVTRQLAPITSCTATGANAWSSCDPRCVHSSTSSGVYYCSVNSSNLHCVCGCTTNLGGYGNIYRWVGTDRCDTFCPPKYWAQNAGQYCTACHAWCQTCTGVLNTQCLSCTGTSYQLNATSCYQQPGHRTYGTAPDIFNRRNPCLHGHYGRQITRTCLACPIGCATCAIHLTTQMPGVNFDNNYDQGGTNCTGDPTCKYTLRCYSCNGGYTLINGFCISNTQCWTYSSFVSSGAFSHSSCKCFANFQLLALSFCAKCSISCLTCTAADLNACVTCPTGAALSGTSCVYSTQYQQLQNWNTGTGTLPASSGWTTTPATPTPPAGVDTSGCSADNYVFGYFGVNNLNNAYYSSAGGNPGVGGSWFPAGATLTYNKASGVTVSHYGIRVRATILFIDEWRNGMTILFQEAGFNRFQFSYKMQGIVGQYICGLNYHDHFDVVDDWFTHTATSVTNLHIKASRDGYAWGIRDVILHVLKCHYSCLTCTGPSNQQCVTCVANQVSVAGVCLCDKSTGYYNNSGTCATSCSGGMVKDNHTHYCVPVCIFPLSFAHLGFCVVECPPGFYKNFTNFVCTGTCYNSGITNQALNLYRFDGIDRVCNNTCPFGTYGDPSSGNCVRTCPAYSASTNDGWFSHGSFCYQICPSSLYAYVPSRSCLSSCPSGYFKNQKTKTNSLTSVSSTMYICEQQCTITLTGIYKYGDNVTGECTNYCSDLSYGDIATFLCLRVCNNSAFGQALTIPGPIVQRLCVINCSVTNELYGNPQTGYCVAPANCPANFYADRITFQCGRRCTHTDQFGDNTTKTCATTCTAGFKQNDSKICVATCLTNNTLIQPQYGDPVSRYCVQSCTGLYFADRQANMQCVRTCSPSPASTFGLSFMCVTNCSATTWADPYHANRICTQSCTNNAVNESYGVNQTRACVIVCPDDQFAHNVSGIPLCTWGCSGSLFGNVKNNRCQAQCPAPYYGDITGNRTCLFICPLGYFGQDCNQANMIFTYSINRVCTLACTCGWADNTSQLCVWNSSGCANFTFAHQTNHKCVGSSQCTGYGDPVSRYCINPCFANSTHYYFADRSTKMCVLQCPSNPNYFGDNNTQSCELACHLTSVRDPQYMRRCVLHNNCSTSFLFLYGDQVKDLCVIDRQCSDGYYADNITHTCIQICPGPGLWYADNVTKQCVSVCQLGYYGFNITTGKGICSKFCPGDLFADNRTVTCVPVCTNNTYGVNYTLNWIAFTVSFTEYGICQNKCPQNQFARDGDNLCVFNCSANLWGNPLNRTCEKSPFDCPEGYYADNNTHMCVVPLQCSFVAGVQYVADNTTKSCVVKCPPLSTIHNFADMNKFLCVRQCPDGYFGFNSTLRCQLQCKFPNSSWEGSFADPQLDICVQICSATPIATFGQNDTFTCVEAKYCPANTWAQVAVYNRQCRPTCPSPNMNSGTNPRMYADNKTKTCVTICPTYTFGDISRGYGICQFVCPDWGNGTRQFSDNSTKLCVQVCPALNGTWGDNTTRACVARCPLGAYAQQLPYRYCVNKCSPGTWGQDVKRTCVHSPLQCPVVNGSIYYAQDISTMCVKTCPLDASTTDGWWGQNTTKTCRTSCLLSSGVQSGYKWNKTRVCINQCPAEIGRDGSYSDQGMCYYVCMTSGFFRDPQRNRSCRADCSFSPIQQYQDSTTMRCLAQCPTFPLMYYRYNVTWKCLSNCPGSYKKYQPTKSCQAICPNNTFHYVQKDQCVDRCPFNTQTNHQLFGDATQSQPICVNNTDCPAGYYADDRLIMCMNACSNGQWIHGKDCVVQCPNGFYGNPTNMTCVIPMDCPADHYADNITVTCVSKCSGSFAYVAIKMCVNVCPVISSVMYYADPVTRICATTCTHNATIQLHENHLNQTCVSDCDPDYYLDPFLNSCQIGCTNGYYADNSSRTCVQICPATPSLFGQNGTFTCVSECLVSSQWRHIPSRLCVNPCPANYFKDNNTRVCVMYCSNISYADTASGYCIFNCTPNYAYDDTKTCIASCPSPYFNDPTTMKCVFFCPTFPLSYFQHVNGSKRQCITSCPQGFYRDYSNYACVSTCPASPLTFADNTTGNCLTVCSDGYYGYEDMRTCRVSCPNGMYADPLTRRCVEKCDPLLDYFGDRTLAIPACVKICSSGTYTDPFTQTCQTSCPNAPKMYGFDNGDTVNPVRECLYTCPFFYLADNDTGKCQLSCISSAQPYIDQASQSCVSNCSSTVYLFKHMPSGQTTNGSCVKFCPGGTFAFLNNHTCVSKCPNGWYGSSTNNTCYQNCSLANNQYADASNNLCVATCHNNATYFSYADQHMRKCVTSCPNTTHVTVGDKLIWKCVRRCSSLTQYADPISGTCVSLCPPSYFADNVTQTCVTNCSLFTLSYGDINSRTCVATCQNTTLYADDSTRLCVNASSCPPGFYAHTTRKVCLAVCPHTLDLFGDPVTKTCQSSCSLTPVQYYADWSTRLCVTLCPAQPSLFGYNISHRCIQQCPNGTFADNYTRFCARSCSISPVQTFADNSTNRCVDVCPTQPFFFASNQTWQCVFQCPSSPLMFGDNSTRSCVYFCPGGVINTYADSSTRRCVDVCPGSTYNQNSTRTCQGTCLSGFADPKSKYCIAICPAYTYGDNQTKTCGPNCGIIFTQQTYAQDANRLCMSECLSIYRTFRDPHTKRCVRVCPISQGTFAEMTNRICQFPCPSSPLTYADFSTRTCVSRCPSIPALFAISLSDRVCSAVCNNGTWAQNNTRFCTSLCVTSPQTFGDNSTWACVATCPTKPNWYADNSTHLCVPVCPPSPDLYADNITRKCVHNCPNGTFADPTTRRCVTTCPDGYYGVNSTLRCVTGCPWRQFADNLTHLCVARCSVDPIFYGNPDTLRCIPQCPVATSSFGNPISQQCVKYLSTGFSGCPVMYFADNVSRLCVQVCPMANDTYGDNSTWKCVVQCPGGSVNTFADNSTMRCVGVCPAYPQFYAQEYSRRCVHYCLQANGSYSGSFSDNSTRLCVERCPSSPDYYSDNSTRRCVFYCPRDPLTFADNHTRRCVAVCPSNPDIYGDLKTLRCVVQCPRDQQTFADNTTRLCVKVCPSSPALFAQNDTLRCLPYCPNNSYADNHTRRCVARCPRHPQTYGDPSTQKCVSTCPFSPDLYADPNTQMCIYRCPETFYAQNNTRRCLQQCLYNQTGYADNYTNRCVRTCPRSQSTYGDNYTHRCVLQCPSTPFTFADGITQTCLKICLNQTNGGFGDNVTRVCVPKCPDRSYGDITTRYCVRYCPNGWFAQDENNTCVQRCPTPYFADNTTWKCVQKCSVVQNVFGESINNTCVYSCPQGTYSSNQFQECVVRCPNHTQTNLTYDTFGFNDTNRCVSQCPFPLYGYPVAQVCVDVCPDPYYQNITSHLCLRCPIQCQSCNYPQLCLTCIVNHFLYAGACVQSCPTFPVITYANPNRICGAASNCTQGFYALNSTKSCVSTCPAGFFVNIAGQTCDACMRGCISCSRADVCMACNANISVWSDYKCYMFCSRRNPFYSTTGCVRSCPEGTYQQLTTCKPCSRLCKSCVISAQNCRVCADGYYISSGVCLSKCPTGTTPQLFNGSQTCVSCSIANCQIKPLTFKTTQFVNNLEFTVQVQFSQAVDITKQIDKVLRLQKRTRTRLLVQVFTYLDYTIINHGNGLYSFILNNYDPNVISDIQVQILDPSAIVSPSGQIPQTTRSSISVQNKSIYKPEDYIQHIPNYIYVVVILAFILLIFTFWTHHSIWMPIYDYFQYTMVLLFINVNMPPNVVYCLQKLLASAFDFLPNFFTTTYRHAPYDSTLLNNNLYSVMMDVSFLRVLGSIYFIALILGLVLLSAFILSKKSPSKQLKKWAKSFIRQTFWKKHLHAIVYILFLPVAMLTLFGFRLYGYFASTPIQGFSIFSSLLFLLAFLIVAIYFAYRVRRLTQDNPIAYLMIRKGYNFIQYQQTVLIQNKNNYFGFDKNQIDLSNARQPRINELLVFPYPIETRMGPWELSQPLLSYSHKMVTALLLMAAFDNPVIQIVLLLLINILYLVYIIVVKPFWRVPGRQFNNPISIHNWVVICIQLVGFLIFLVLIDELTYQYRILVGNLICGVFIWGVTANIVYFIFRTYKYHHEVTWRKFVRADLFRVNYTVQHIDWSKEYDQEEAKLYKQVKNRAQFLQAIRVQTGQSLADMMKQPSISTNTRQKIKALKLRPNRGEVVRNQYASILSTIANQQQKSHKSVVSSQRLSKNDRKKVRDIIFSEKVEKEREEEYKYTKLQQISQKSEKRSEAERGEVSEAGEEQTEFEFEYIEEEYPEGTPMDQIMRDCKRGDVVMP